MDVLSGDVDVRLKLLHKTGAILTLTSWHQLTMQQQLAEEQKQKQRQLTMQQLPIKVETEAEAEAMSQQIYGEQMVPL